MNEHLPVPRTDSKAGAGAAGVGGGTLMVAIASTLPEDSLIKPWLMYAAPATSVALSAIWLWSQLEIANYMRDRKIKVLAERTRLTLLDSINNPATSEEHRNVIRGKLEQLEVIVADRELERIKDLTPVTANTFANPKAQTKNQSRRTKP